MCIVKLDDLGNAVTELSSDIAATLSALGDFFNGLGDVNLLEVRSIELGGSSLCDVLEFGAVEASVSFDLTLFPNVCVDGVVCHPELKPNIPA